MSISDCRPRTSLTERVRNWFPQMQDGELDLQHRFVSPLRISHCSAFVLIMTIRVAVVATLTALHWDGHWLTHVTVGPAYWHRRQRFFSAFLRSSTIFINVHCVVFGPVGNVFVPFEYANDIWIVRRFQFASPVDLHSKLSFWRIDGYPTGLRTVSRLLVLVIRPLLRQIGVGIGEWRLPLRMTA